VSAPLYDVLVVLHVVSAIVGFGAIAVSGLEASSGRRSPDPAADESLVAYFRPGTSWPARSVFLVPVLGLILLFGGDRSDASRSWPWIGLALWVAAMGLATGICWPSEHRAQEALATDVPDVARFRQACCRLERGVVLIEVLVVAAVAVMILQPA